MRVYCVSNDSEMFIFHDVRNERGLRPQDHAAYVDALTKIGYDVPDCNTPEIMDPSLEHYKMALGEALGGRFTEVRRFHKSIEGSGLGIISSRHGLMDSEKEVLPYQCAAEGRRDVVRLDDRTSFTGSLMEIHRSYDIILLFLPRAYTELILERWEGSMTGMIFVTSESLFKTLEKRGALALPRRGARIGKHNLQPILEELRRNGWCGRRDLNPSSKLGKLK